MIYETKTCQYCNEQFSNIEGRIFSNHVRWCDKNLSNGDKGKTSISQTAKKKLLEKTGGRRKFQVTCIRCNNSFIVDEYEKLHPMRKMYFCSRSCANNRGNRTPEERKNISRGLRNRFLSSTKKISCLECMTSLEVREKSTQIFCSKSCSYAYRSKSSKSKWSKKRIYRDQCKFTFGLKSYPDEFDFSLIEKFGWYKASNRGNNLQGISRDHIVSVDYGFRNNISPAIISHPANCRLMKHDENLLKNRKSDMSIDQLLEKIKAWDTRYQM